MASEDSSPPQNVLGMLTQAIQQLTRTTEKLETTIEAISREMRSEYVQHKVLDPQLTDIKNDINKLASHWDWLIKVVAVIIIGALLGLVIAQGGKA